MGAILAQDALGPQTDSSTGQQQPVAGRPGLEPEEKDETVRQMQERLAIKRNEDRQRQLVKDTDKLVDLASELKTEATKTDKDILSSEVLKKAEQIERLAKSVREKMKAD